MSFTAFVMYHFLTLTVHSEGGNQRGKEELAPIYLIYGCCSNQDGPYEKAAHCNRHNPA